MLLYEALQAHRCPLWSVLGIGFTPTEFKSYAVCCGPIAATAEATGYSSLPADQRLRKRRFLEGRGSKS
jgi:hypothetical protein